MSETMWTEAQVRERERRAVVRAVTYMAQTRGLAKPEPPEWKGSLVLAAEWYPESEPGTADDPHIAGVRWMVDRGEIYGIDTREDDARWRPAPFIGHGSLGSLVATSARVRLWAAMIDGAKPS